MLIVAYPDPFNRTFETMLLQLIFTLIPLFSSFNHQSGTPVLTNSVDSLTVYVFLHDECVISQYYTPQLTEYYNQYKSQKVGFVGYFPNPSLKPYHIKTFAQNFKLAFPLQQDYRKDWTKKFGITVTPEVAVWDHRTDLLIYRGRIDDSYVRVGKRKMHVKSKDLKNVIDAWISGQASSTLVETPAIGCFINLGMTN